jgi:hypothetical protein
MAQDNTLARSLHDLGLATWFGGSLMGAVGLNGAAAVVDAPPSDCGSPTPAGRAGPRSTWPGSAPTWPAVPCWWPATRAA